jgi:SAM-dependent methyltransferase
MNMHSKIDDLSNGERQVSPTIEGIRRDHVARYEFAAKLIGKRKRIIDLACGIGYGSALLADAGHTVIGIDRSAAAIDYGREHYARRRAALSVGDVMDAAGYEADAFDAAVCFETIEHLADPLPMLKALHAVARRLVASVPNETVMPHRGRTAHHFRHYTKAQFAALLEKAGWQVTSWHGQASYDSEVEGDIAGRTLIAAASRAPKATDREKPKAKPADLPTPDHVVILGLGPSLEAYVDLVKRLGNRRRLADEVWGINAVGDIVQCDRIFHMDDVRVQELRAEAKPQSNIAAMLEWMKIHPGPIYTSRPNPAYPGLVEFPLEDVINSCTTSYFNSTAAYAVAFAIHVGVKKISLFGFDFTYQNSHHAEKGRACVEFWLGVAWARGIDITLPPQTSLMDANEPEQRKFYGFDFVDVTIDHDEGGQAKVSFTDKEKLPTAAEIEAEYDHDQHPNKLVRDAT